MTIAHQVYLATTESAEQIATRVSRLLGETGLSEQPPAVETLIALGGAPTVHGTRIHVSVPPPEPFDVVEAEFGVPSKIQIWIEPDKDEPLSTQDDDTVVLVAGLLAEIPADAVLIHNYETAWLIRRGDELVLHERPTLWPEHRLALIKGPYRRESHQL